MTSFEQQKMQDVGEVDIENLKIAYEDEPAVDDHGRPEASSATWWASCYCKITSGLCPS